MPEAHAQASEEDEDRPDVVSGELIKDEYDADMNSSQEE